VAVTATIEEAQLVYGFPGLRNYSTPWRRINRAATAVDSAITRSFRSSANA